jgi:hypothetical protein
VDEALKFGNFSWGTRKWKKTGQARKARKEFT